MRRLALATLLLAALPSPALGWTEAEVVSARAHVTVDREANALVALVVTVNVRGGWLEGLELSDLDSGFALDEAKPPWAVAVGELTTGEEHKWAPSVRVRDDGRVQLSFGRRDAPRRGRIEVGLVYRASLVERLETAEEGSLRATWTLPPFRSGLDGVDIAVTVPDEAGSSVHEFHRVHLPRTVAWTVSVDVPETAMDEALRVSSSATSRRKTAGSTSRPPTPADPLGLLAFALALVVVLGRDRFRAACARRGATARPLIPGHTVLVALVCAVLTAAIAFSDGYGPLFDLIALGAIGAFAFQRAARTATAPPRFGAFRSASRKDRRAAARARLLERLGSSVLFDATTPIGALATAAALFSAVVLAGEATHEIGPALLAVVLLALPFVSGTRHALPDAAETRLVRLEGLARALRPRHPAALALVVRTAGRGTPTDARIEVHPALAPSGLVRLDVALDDAEALGVRSVSPRLLVVTRDGSPAESAIAGLAPTAPVILGAGKKLGRVLELASLDAALAALALHVEPVEAADTLAAA